MKKLPKDLGARIKQRRETHGYSQADLAEIVGLSQPAIGDIENSRVKPKTPTLREIGRALSDDFGVEWLFEGSPLVEVPFEVFFDKKIRRAQREFAASKEFDNLLEEKVKKAVRDIMHTGRVRNVYTETKRDSPQSLKHKEDEAKKTANK